MVKPSSSSPPPSNVIKVILSSFPLVPLSSPPPPGSVIKSTTSVLHHISIWNCSVVACFCCCCCHALAHIFLNQVKGRGNRADQITRARQTFSLQFTPLSVVAEISRESTRFMTSILCHSLLLISAEGPSMKRFNL